jgi:hypothetical protein
MLSVNSPTRPLTRRRLGPASLFWLRVLLVLTLGIGSVTLVNRVPVEKHKERSTPSLRLAQSGSSAFSAASQCSRNSGRHASALLQMTC